jgi:hypothetical protein
MHCDERQVGKTARARAKRARHRATSMDDGRGAMAPLPTDDDREFRRIAASKTFLTSIQRRSATLRTA